MILNVKHSDVDSDMLELTTVHDGTVFLWAVVNADFFTSHGNSIAQHGHLPQEFQVEIELIED